MAKGQDPQKSSEYGQKTLDEWSALFGVTYDELVSHVDEVRNRPSTYRGTARVVTPQRSLIYSKKIAGDMLAFLTKYRESCLLVESAKAAGVSLRLIKAWRGEFSVFDDMCSDIQDVIVDVAEDELYKRAVLGEEKGIYHQGALVDTVKDKSNDLLKFMLTANRPKYKAKSEVAMTGADGGPIQIEDANMAALREKLFEKLLAKQGEVAAAAKRGKK